MPPGSTAFDDAVHGRIEFDGANIEDFVILRSDDYPTYHLSVVVDDVEMGITDVIRGDDHISNTPKHVLLFQALGAPVPRFAHVPLILGSDKKRLSKRHGATSVTEYQRQGYLPEAMVNFLALLGWSPGDDRELMTTTDLIASFALDGISGGNAVFNTEKLDWMNGQYIARMPIDDLASMVRPLFDESGLGANALVQDTASFHRLLELLRPRAKRLTDFVDQGRPLVVDDVAYEQEAVDKHLARRISAGHVAALVEALGQTRPFDEAQVEAAVRGTATARGIKAGALIHATRVALTGRTTSPGLFEVVTWLGPERTAARLTRLLEFLSTRVRRQRSVALQQFASIRFTASASRCSCGPDTSSIGVAIRDNSSREAIVHPLPDGLAVADVVRDERRVNVRQDIEVVAAAGRHRLHVRGRRTQIPLVPDRGRERIGIADQHPGSRSRASASSIRACSVAMYVNSSLRHSSPRWRRASVYSRPNSGTHAVW